MRRVVIVPLAVLCACNLITGASELTIGGDCPGCPTDVPLPDREDPPPDVGDAADVDEADAEASGGVHERPFGGVESGVVSTPLVASPVGVGVMKDGSFVVVGSEGRAIVVVRFEADGTLDTDYGDDGKLTIGPVSSETLVANGVAVDSEDRALVAGSFDLVTDDGAGTVTRSHNHYVVRITKDGSLDTSFSADGRYRGSGNNEDAFAVAVDPTDAVLLAGKRLTSTGAVWRLTSIGGPDVTFGPLSGRGALSPPGPGRAVVPTSSGVFAAFAVNGDFGAGRMTQTGAADTAFGANGLAVTPVGESTDTPVAAAPTPDGKIVVVGEVVVESPVFVRTPQFGVARYDAIKLDESFGQGGTVIESFDPLTPFQSASDVPSAVVVDAQKRIVVVGHARERADDQDRYRVVAMRLLEDGSLDPRFGTGGKMTFSDPDASFQVRAAASQPNGKIVVVGTDGSSLLVSRIIP